MAAQRTLRQRRQSITDTVKATAESIRQTATTTAQSLLHWDDLPPWRRDNVYIQTGYRQLRGSYANSARSLFYVHNEFVNIWSHLLGAIVFAASSAYVYYVVQPRYETASASDVIVFACFFTGAITCLGMSATFHSLVDHSEAVAKWGNKLDYTGIVGLIVGSYMPALYYGFYCETELMTLYMTLICALGVGCTVVSWVDFFRKPEWRPHRAAMFISLGLSGVIPVVHGIWKDGFQALQDRMSVGLVMLHGAMYIFGAILYAVRWPERSFPGKVDIWGSSHQIFHIFVVMAAATHFYAMSKAFDYHHSVMGSKC